MVRAFVAVRISPDMAEKISEVQGQLKQNLRGVRWVAPGNLHFTVKFLGAVQEERITSITNALQQALHIIPRFVMVTRGIGIFPDIRRARVLWVGLEGEGLRSVVAEVEAALHAIGFEREKRVSRPHLTIGRWRDFDRRPELPKQEIERWKEFAFGESWVEEVVLLQSILKPEGAVYSQLGVIPLSGQ